MRGMSPPSVYLPPCNVSSMRAALEVRSAGTEPMSLAARSVPVSTLTRTHARTLARAADMQAYGSLDDNEIKCELVGADESAEIPLTKQLFVRPFPTRHRVPSQGYVVWRRRSKLKDEFVCVSARRRAGTRCCAVRQPGTWVVTDLPECLPPPQRSQGHCRAETGGGGSDPRGGDAGDRCHRRHDVGRYRGGWVGGRLKGGGGTTARDTRWVSAGV